MALSMACRVALELELCAHEYRMQKRIRIVDKYGQTVFGIFGKNGALTHSVGFMVEIVGANPPCQHFEEIGSPEFFNPMYGASDGELRTWVHGHVAAAVKAVLEKYEQQSSINWERFWSMWGVWVEFYRLFVMTPWWGIEFKTGYLPRHPSWDQHLDWRGIRLWWKHQPGWRGGTNDPEFLKNDFFLSTKTPFERETRRKA